jgi:NAD-dependent SIR2 family protein deacetylase
VIFTGAGASKADGLPVQTELFSQFFDRAAKRDSRLTLRQQVKDFFQNVFLIDPTVTGSRLPTFEEALGVVELAILRSEDILGIRAEEMRRQLILALAATIAEPNTAGAAHRELVRRLREQDALTNVTFVTTNYDTLIDDAIEAEAVGTGRGIGSLVDYGLAAASSARTQRHAETRTVSCYKLHGSLNWLYCQTCSSLDVTYSTNGVTRLLDDPDAAGCPTCDSPRIPVIVPPSYFKDISNLYLSLVWNRAFQALKGADRIVFCGYSFPDADMHVKFLIKRAQLNRDQQSVPLRVDLVNHFPGKSPDAVTVELERYRRFLGYQQVFDSGLSFTDFAADPLHLINTV